MISDQIAIHDLDHDEFGLLCGLMSARDFAGASELQILHRAGVVVHAVTTDGSDVPPLPSRIGDPAAFAVELVRSGATGRAVIVEEAGLLTLVAELEAQRRPADPQPELFFRASRAFHASPAVHAHPPEPPNSWPALAEHVSRRGDGWSLLAAYDGERCVLALLGRWEAGLLVELTSSVGDRPPLARAGELVDAAPGPLVCALVAELETLRGMCAEPDLPGALLDPTRSAGIIRRTGLDALEAVAR